MSLAILDLINTIILPEYCIICGKSGPYICGYCLKHSLKVNFQNICHVCGKTTYTRSLHKECEDSTNVSKLYFFCEYNKAAKKVVETVKYGGSFAVIEVLATNMVKYINFVGYSADNLVITSVPSHWNKKNIRGFNQSELLAKKISAKLGVEYKTLLKKVKNTKKQAGTTKNLRNTTQRNTFAVNANIIPENVMIIDDVHTTGATLNECASILAKYGAKTIVGYTFSKSLKYSSNDSFTA